jgi:cystathionine beta-lyase
MKNKSTIAVHAGGNSDKNTGGINTPLVMSSAYDYLDQPEVRYPRYFNTANHDAVAEKLRALEGAEAGLVLATGMAAISSIFLSILKRGDHVVFLDGLYGGTHDFVTSELAPRGIEYDFAGISADDIIAGVRGNTRLIYVESPANPLMDVVDLAAIAEFARDKDILTAIDNTFASPILQNPIKFGFDLVMHSATKYLGGHSDLCCGALLGSKALIDRILPQAIRYGGSPDAYLCWLLERSLKTLAIRVERQSDNALIVAQALEGQPGINRVMYPGLESHPAHRVAKKQMSGFGGMLSFELAADADPVAYQRRLNIVVPAVSLGGVESTICQPVMTSHSKMPAAERQRLGITDNLLRLSTGIEAAEDIIEDLLQAM